MVADAGLLVPVNDVNDVNDVHDGADPSRWQQAIEMLTLDRARRCELARRGRERAEAVYGWPIVAQQHIDFFERVIARRRV